MNYIALLRGINVGGNNLIKMADLKQCFERNGFADVSSYIQSGNILFSSSEKNLAKLTSKIETMLTKQFKYKSTVVVVSEKQMESVVKNAPKGFGQKPYQCRYDVLFLRAPLNPKEAIKHLEAKEGVDQIFAGKEAVYFSRRVSKITQSRINKIILSPIYKNITVRNWNTATKLFNLIKPPEGGLKHNK